MTVKYLHYDMNISLKIIINLLQHANIMILPIFLFLTQKQIVSECMKLCNTKLNTKTNKFLHSANNKINLFKAIFGQKQYIFSTL